MPCLSCPPRRIRRNDHRDQICQGEAGEGQPEATQGRLMRSPRTVAYLSVILAMIFWGFTFVLYKFANESFRPVTIVFLRLFVSIFFLFGFALLFRRLGRIRKKDQKWFLLMALFEPFFYFLGEANGMTLVTANCGSGHHIHHPADCALRGLLPFQGKADQAELPGAGHLLCRGAVGHTEQERGYHHRSKRHPADVCGCCIGRWIYHGGEETGE